MRASISKKTLATAQFAMLLAVEAIVSFTPLGSIPIGPLVATLGMIPVILTSILMGTAAGSAMGFCAGLFSFLVWTFAPPSPLTAFVFTPVYSLGPTKGNFWSLVICFVPRILVGTVSGLCFQLFTRLKWKAPFAYGVSGVLGSLVNTLLVLGGIYVFFGSSYASAIEQNLGALPALIGAVVLTNGIPEAVLGGVAAYAVGFPVRRHVTQNFE